LKLFKLKAYSLDNLIKQRKEVYYPEVYHYFLTKDYICKKIRKDFLDSLPSNEKAIQEQKWDKLLNNPNFSDSKENAQRTRMLLGSRRWLITELPPDIKYFKVKVLICSNLKEHIIAPWKDQSSYQKNENAKSQAQKYLNGLIFYQTKSGKLFLLEGNHRYGQWISDKCPEVEVEVYILSAPSHSEFSWDPDSSKIKLMDYQNNIWV
jgi:hypothetical protein